MKFDSFCNFLVGRFYSFEPFNFIHNKPSNEHFQWKNSPSRKRRRWQHSSAEWVFRLKKNSSAIPVTEISYLLSLFDTRACWNLLLNLIKAENNHSKRHSNTFPTKPTRLETQNKPNVNSFNESSSHTQHHPPFIHVPHYVGRLRKKNRKFYLAAQLMYTLEKQGSEKI